VSQPLRILVVEDDAIDREAVRRGLVAAGIGGAVDEVDGPADALARLQAAAYDCVLLDHHLPGTTGLELLTRIRALAPATPVVILTGRGDEDLAAQLMKAGASDYLTKASMTPERLAAAVRHATEIARLGEARRRAEEARRAEELRFRTLANAIPQLAWTARPDGDIDWWNQRWVDYTGATLGDSGGWRWAELVHPEHVDRVVESARRHVASGDPWEETYPLRGASGEYRWFLARAVPMRAPDGTVAGWFGTGTDVSAHIETERAVRESEERFRRALDIETVGVAFFSLDGTVTRANQAFLAMSGHGRAGVDAGQVRWADLAHADFAARVLAAVAELGMTARATPNEAEYVRPDGTRWWGLMTARRISDHECVAFVLDITERKQAEAERERLLEREQQARGQAERAIRARDEVLAIVAHDLRNPLQTILTSASISALPRVDDERHRRSLKVIERSTRDMDRLITDLLDVARIDAGSYAIRAQKVSPRALLGEIVDRFDVQAKSRGVELAVEIEGELPAIEGDHDALLRVLSNLVGNALRFVPEGGRIALSARRLDDALELAVADTGSGIAPEALPHVFDRFWRADRAARGGAGLGLAICKGIVEAHGGRIWAESDLGRGTTFRFTVPRALQH
jgi:PAS domain S-box-containing protein